MSITDFSGSLRRDGDLTRRKFVLGSTYACLGAMALNGAQPAKTSRMADINCIFLVLNGGPSQLDTWDVKPTAVEEIRGPFRPIATTTPGVWISELFPRLACVMNKVALIRTLCHDDEACHIRGQRAIQTGRRLDGEIGRSCFGSVLAQLKGSRNGVPANILLPSRLDETAPLAPPWARCLTATARSGAMRHKYGNSRFGENCQQARALIELGARFVTVNMFETVLHEPSWDTHGCAPYSTMESLRETVCPQFDIAYSALLEDLEECGLLDTTMVVALGEFGRSPWINAYGGREHHASCWSGLVAGGGVRGGQVIGTSDDRGHFPKDRPVSLYEFAASIYHGLGVPCTTEVTHPTSGAIRLIDVGVQPVYELF